MACEWLRIGCTGFGGPPVLISLLRRLCVVERRWLTAHDFEDAVAVVNLLPGPSRPPARYLLRLAPSRRLWRSSRRGLPRVVPGLAAILALAALFLDADRATFYTHGTHERAHGSIFAATA